MFNGLIQQYSQRCSRIMSQNGVKKINQWQLFQAYFQQKSRSLLCIQLRIALLEMMKYLDESNKMLVFDNEQTNRSVTLTLQVLESDLIINIRSVVNYFYTGQDICTKFAFKIYDPYLQDYVLLPDNFMLPAYFFVSPVVMFKYKILDPTIIIENEIERKERNPERTIGEAIESVRRWRNAQKRTGSKKVSLVDAARMVGVSKKTLDDYFGQLRLGEFYGFDYENNLKRKFGVLRSFVKAHRPVRQKKNRNDKFPRRLRILDALLNEPSTAPQQYRPQPPKIISPIPPKPQQTNKPIEVIDLTPMDRLQQDEYENQFYKCYEIMLNEPKDPFVPYQARDYRQYKHLKQQELNDMELLHYW